MSAACLKMEKAAIALQQGHVAMGQFRPNRMIPVVRPIGSKIPIVDVLIEDLVLKLVSTQVAKPCGPNPTTSKAHRP